MALTFADALNLCRSTLNASTGSAYTTNDDQDRHPDQEIADAIRAADGLIYSAVGNTPGHPKRFGLFVATSVAHRGMIPDHLGDFGDVLVNGQKADLLDAAEIEVVRTNTLGLSTPSSRFYYDIVNNRLYYSGSTGTIDIVPPFVDSGMSLQTPQDYFYGVVAKALAILFAKEGSETPTAQHFGQLGDAVLEWVARAAQSIPKSILDQSKGANNA